MSVDLVLAGIGLIGLLCAALLFAFAPQSLVSATWPRVRGRVIECRFRAHGYYMLVEVESKGERLRLRFLDVPREVDFDAEVWLRLHPRFPSIFNDYEHPRRNMRAARITALSGIAAGVVLLLLSLLAVYLSVTIAER